MKGTGVLSLGNPCTVGTWYLASGVGGVLAAGGMNAAAVGAVASTYWPSALAWGSRLVYGAQMFPGTGLLGLAIRDAPYVYKGTMAACNAAQSSS